MTSPCQETAEGVFPCRRTHPCPGMLRTAREFCRLARLEGGGFSVVAVFGALAVQGGSLPITLAAGLFCVNLLFLLGACVHNDLADMEVDRQAEKLSTRPLVKGLISRQAAALLWGSCWLGALLLARLLTPRPTAIVMLVAAMGFAFLYNRFSKRFSGSDLFFACSAALLCLYGSRTAGAQAPLGGAPHTLLAAVVGIVFLDHLVFNALEGGLKDLGSDAHAGASTLVRRFLAADRNGRLHFTRAGRVFFLGLKACSVGLALLPSAVAGTPVYAWQVVALGATAGLTLALTGQLVCGQASDRRRIFRLTLMQETACRTLVPLMLARVAGPEWTLLLVLIPLLWFLVTNPLLNGSLFWNTKTL
ncbi:MAG: UbiA prenyltransferase family protein [Lentisphaeria bacterium]|nr:UbiA prenyltransferase family protein [Lentisphaeria bacterium]